MVTTSNPTPNILQAGCPSCCPTNSVKALNWELLMLMMMIGNWTFDIVQSFSVGQEAAGGEESSSTLTA